MSDGETTQIACVPVISDCSPITCRAKEIFRSGCYYLGPLLDWATTLYVSTYYHKAPVTTLSMEGNGG